MTQPTDPNQPGPPPDPYAVPPAVPPAPPYGTPAPPYGTPPPPPGYAPPPYGYAAAPPPPYGYAPATPTGTDGFAIASLVCAFFCSPLGVIFGFVSLRRIKRSQQGGRGLAIAGLVISALAIVGAIAVFAAAAAGRANRSDNGTITTSGKVATTDLHVGDCINYPASGITSVRTFDAVPCSQAHDGEAFASGNLPLTGDWPGDSAVTTATESQCRTAFEPFIGISFDSSSLAVTYFYPEQATWSTGDRGYVCVVGVDGTKSTGTLKGAGR